MSMAALRNTSSFLLAFLLAFRAGSTQATPAGWACDGVTDNAAYFQALLDGPDAYQALSIPAGTCDLYRAIRLPNHPVTLLGQGVDLSILRWRVPVAVGLSGAYSSPFGYSVSLSRLSLVTTVQSGTALNLDWPDDVWSGYLPTAIIRDVVIRSELGVSGGWWIGLRLEDAWNAVVENVTVNGGVPTSYNAFSMERAVQVSKRSIGVRLSNLHVNWANYGVFADGPTEGLTIDSNTELVGCRIGVFVSSDTQSPSLFVSHIHVAAITAGLLLSNRTQAVLDHNLLYQWSGPVEGPFYGILLLAGTEAATLTGNTVMARADNPNAYGYWINPGVSDTYLLGNRAQLMAAGVVNLGTGTQVR